VSGAAPVRTVLVVDDEANIRGLFRDELEEAGYRVLTAGSWAEAETQLARERPDLVTLDIRMSDGPDGIEALRQIKERHPGLPVVLVTAYGEYRADFATWAADGYVVKSADLTELKARIALLLGGPPA
jgi:DNA-binding response OmpR family regulator